MLHDPMGPAMSTRGEVTLGILTGLIEVLLPSEDAKRASSRECSPDSDADKILTIGPPKHKRTPPPRTANEPIDDDAHVSATQCEMFELRYPLQGRSNAL